MVRMTTVQEETLLAEFINRAIEFFDDQDYRRTFTNSGNIESGELLAIRWGLSEDCMMVLRVTDSDDFNPIIYQQCLSRPNKTVKEIYDAHHD